MNRKNIHIDLLELIFKRTKAQIEHTTIPYFSKDDMSTSFAMLTKTPIKV